MSGRLRDEPSLSIPGETASGTVERRKSARYVPVMDRAHLGWWEGAEFRTDAARILNLSLEGAALLIAGRATEEAAVWVSIAGLEWSGWAAADVVGTLVSSDQGRVLRLKFAAPLAYEVFRAAVWGFPDEDHAGDAERLVETRGGAVAC